MIDRFVSDILGATTGMLRFGGPTNYANDLTTILAITGIGFALLLFKSNSFLLLKMRAAAGQALGARKGFIGTHVVIFAVFVLFLQLRHGAKSIYHFPYFEVTASVTQVFVLYAAAYGLCRLLLLCITAAFEPDEGP
jgi:hypothetical protein